MNRVIAEKDSTQTNGLRQSRKHLLMLYGACVVLWYWTCGLWDLWGADEGRYAQVAKELLGRKNWFFLTVHGEPYDQKPPLPSEGKRLQFGYFGLVA